MPRRNKSGRAFAQPGPAINPFPPLRQALHDARPLRDAKPLHNTTALHQSLPSHDARPLQNPKALHDQPHHVSHWSSITTRSGIQWTIDQQFRGELLVHLKQLKNDRSISKSLYYSIREALHQMGRTPFQIPDAIYQPLAQAGLLTLKPSSATTSPTPFTKTSPSPTPAQSANDHSDLQTTAPASLHSNHPSTSKPELSPPVLAIPKPVSPETLPPTSPIAVPSPLLPNLLAWATQWDALSPQPSLDHVVQLIEELAAILPSTQYPTITTRIAWAKLWSTTPAQHQVIQALSQLNL